MMYRIYDSDGYVVDYDNNSERYRVSIFNDGHFNDEFWFDTYEKVVGITKDTPMPIERFKKYNHEWWVGYCPRCNNMVRFDFDIDSKEGNRKCHCIKCGQLCDFEDR